MSLEDTVGALVQSLCQRFSVEGDVARARREQEVAAYVLGRFAQMPDHLRLGVALLTHLFSLSAVITNGRPFAKLSKDKQALRVQAWRQSRLSARRNLLRYYEALSVYGWYSLRYPDD